MAEVALRQRLPEHPNIITCVAWLSDWTPTALHITQIMDLCPFSLRQYLRMVGGKLSGPEIAACMVGLLVGTLHCHQHAVLHGDLKHDNLLLGRFPAGTAADPNRWMNVLLCNFSGSASVEAVDVGAQDALRGQITTTWWASPEQHDNGLITFAADMWSVGVILGLSTKHACITNSS